MCGIFTAIYKKGKNLDINSCLESLEKLKKRGPDWSFYKKKEKIFFGQTVLSMSGRKKIDINSHYSKSKRYFILFNGEIYNYKHLKNKYCSYISDQCSDTEVLVNLFDKLPIDKILNEIDGMYAFLLFDNYRNTITFSRDVQGEKSLYFYEDKEKILISSDSSSFLHRNCEVKLDNISLQNYFNSRHYLQLRETSFQKVKNILPGETIEIDLKNFKKKIKKKNLFSLIKEKSYLENKKSNIEELSNHLENLLIKNLKQMSPIKRKYCSILSGGIDSTLISKILDKHSNPEFFLTINHLGKDKISNQVNKFKKHFKKKIKIIDVDLNQYYKKLKLSLRVFSSPVASHDFPGKLILSEEAKKNGCKAIFGGDGADELFGGYKTYVNPIKNYKTNTSQYSRYIRSSVKLSKKKNNVFREKLQNYWDKCLSAYSFLEKEEKYRQAMMLIDTSLQLSSVGLRGNDMMFMNNSIESRSVFLRKDIINFALNLPIENKIDLNSKKKFRNKVILKKIFLKYFPKKFIFDKQGFSGFPNETIKFLGKPENFYIKNILKSNGTINDFNDLDYETKWKILNLEHFYREFSSELT